MSAATAAIETGDTVRYIGRRARWTVGSVDGDTLEVFRIDRIDRRTQRYISRPVRLDRVELVRKGNATDDAVNKLFAEMDALADERAAAVDPDAAALFDAVARKIEAPAPTETEIRAAEAASQAAARREATEAARRAVEDDLVARRTAECDRLVAEEGLDVLSALLAAIDNVPA